MKSFIKTLVLLIFVCSIGLTSCMEDEVLPAVPDIDNVLQNDGEDGDTPPGSGGG